MFYAVVDSNMKIIAGVGAFFLFHDDIYWSQWVGFGFIFVSLLFTCLDKKIKYDEEKGKKEPSDKFIAAVRDTVALLEDGNSISAHPHRERTNTEQLDDEDSLASPTAPLLSRIY
jgi:hypothetical protein